VQCVRYYEEWWRHDEAWERCDYTCGDNEQMEWLPKIHHLGKDKTLNRVSTLPWRPRTVRYLMTALLLPLVL
jgi:hypothetical protein